MNVVARGNLLTLVDEGDAAKEVVSMLAEVEEFRDYLEEIRDIYEVTHMEGDKWPVIYRAFSPESNFLEIFQASRRDRPDPGALLEGLAVALAAFHRRGLPHRCLQPAYVVVDKDGGIHLAGVGFVVYVYTGNTSVEGISEMYMAPEVFDLEEEDMDDLKADVFSFGSIVYYAHVGRHAFEERTTYRIAKLIKEGVPIPREIPQKYRHLIEWCWRPAAERPSMDEVVSYLEE